MCSQCATETPRAARRSRYARNAFRAFAIAPSRVVPDALAPGSAGTRASERLERPRRLRRRAGHRIPVRAGLRIAKDPDHPGLHLRRHRVLEALGLLVGLPPRESEDLDEEPLRQAVSPDDRVGLGLAGL